MDNSPVCIRCVNSVVYKDSEIEKDRERQTDTEAEMCLLTLSSDSLVSSSLTLAGNDGDGFVERRDTIFSCRQTCTTNILVSKMLYTLHRALMY